MKKLIHTFLGLLMAIALNAQTDGLSYQAVIIDNNPLELPGSDIEGLYLANGQVRLRFTIYQNTGDVLYQEVHNATTDAYGMVNLVIGQGEMTAESNQLFTEIDWDGLPKDLGVEVGYENSDFEELSRQGLLFLPYAFHRNITATGTLDVDGVSTFNSDLNVENAAPTSLTGTLNVQGDANFEGKADFIDIEVANTTVLNGPVSVLNESPTFLSGNLNVDGNTTLNDPLTVNATSALNGQVTIDADTDGSQSDYGSYPLRVQGSTQGIAVRVDGSESQSKNYLSFFNGFGTIKGRIEGQTLGELQSSFRFIWDVTMGGLNQAFIAAEGVACGTQLDLVEAGVMVVNTAVLGAQWVELTANYELNVGVAFLSGGADYAEWLEKEKRDEHLHPGEVVGVKNGKVSKVTVGADHYLAVSTNPIVLGNMPEEGEEDTFAKIAFLGQVPIRVVGRVEAGDYILPSGNNDGMAIAAKGNELSTDRFNEIIGVAWEDSQSEAPTLVNVALGLNKNDLSDRVSSMEQELNDLKNQMAEIKAMLSGEAEPISSEIMAGTSVESKDSTSTPIGESLPLANTIEMTDSEFEAWLNEYGYIFEQQMSTLRTNFDEKGIDYNQFEEIGLILNSPLEALRQMRSGSFLPTLWDNFEGRITRKN